MYQEVNKLLVATRFPWDNQGLPFWLGKGKKKIKIIPMACWVNLYYAGQFRLLFIFYNKQAGFICKDMFIDAVEKEQQKINVDSRKLKAFNRYI